MMFRRCLRFFSILITTINFVTSVEVRFYPSYRNYYSLFNDNGSIRDIEQAETEMLTILKHELTFSGHKQLISTILFVVFGSYVLEWLSLGFTDTSIGIFRFLCTGYGIYAISNSIMLILLYFEDYTGALLGTMAFAAVSVVATILQILFGSINFFGLGFLLGGIVFYFIVWLEAGMVYKEAPLFPPVQEGFCAEHGKRIFARLCDRWMPEMKRRPMHPRKSGKRNGGK